MMNPSTVGKQSKAIDSNLALEDQRILPHLAKVIGAIKDSSQQACDIVEVSSIVKQTETVSALRSTTKKVKRDVSLPNTGKKDYLLKDYFSEIEKLREVGISFTNDLNLVLHKELIRLAEQFQVKEIRFWGKIAGTEKDYFIIQGVCSNVLTHSELQKGQEKEGQGANAYTYWVTNNPYSSVWTQLPAVLPDQIKTARNIKRVFTGNLQNTIELFPPFYGKQKHYLKAQLVRMTHALELVPKGVYKVHDDNPKLIEFEEDIKLPQVTELNSLENWLHKNQMLLNLGRCSHYLDPSLPEDQIEAAAAELAEKDPEIQRLRSINQQKPAESLNLGTDNIWILKACGDNQVFTKEDVQHTYTVITLKNIYWPGWITIGYKNGYSNIYIGNGLKTTQPAWTNHNNPMIIEEGVQTIQMSEPNPINLPKAPQQALPEAAPEQQ